MNYYRSRYTTYALNYGFYPYVRFLRYTKCHYPSGKFTPYLLPSESPYLKIYLNFLKSLEKRNESGEEKKIREEDSDFKVMGGTAKGSKPFKNETFVFKKSVKFRNASVGKGKSAIFPRS